VATDRLDDWPGRWLGGLVGAGSSLVAAGLLFVMERPLPDETPSLVGGPMAMFALLGIPIAFALGRAAFPSIRREGWSRALLVGVGIGIAAPPLGAFEIVFGPFLLPLTPADADQLFMIALLPIALVVSYIVVFITVPVGLATALAIRALPAGLPERLRMPAPISRLGVAHAVGALVLWTIAIQVWSAVVRG
jgi:hypothetical protein